MLGKALLSASASTPKVYVEDVFSTYLYTGNGSTQTITNGIDLAGEGGLVWVKCRSTTASHALYDTTSSFPLSSNNSDARDSFSYLTPKNNGFEVTNTDLKTNRSGETYASWTFRKAAKFFDVVTYTGTGSARTVAHNLGSVPGMIIVKRTNSTADWVVYHRSLGNNREVYLNQTVGDSSSNCWNNTTPTATTFTLGNNLLVNGFGSTYVAYLFAHDAGGFGDSGNDSVVSCGSYTGNSSTSGPTVDLGWEPQWLLIKRASGGTGGWFLLDSMRGIATGSADASVQAESANAENTANDRLSLTSTGFQLTTTSSFFNNSGDTYIYLAIRRGPMKTPTVGTEVFSANTYAGGTAGRSFSLGFAPDALLTMRRNTSNFDILQSRLTGRGYMFTNDTSSETTASTGIPAWDADTETIKLTTATSVTGWNGSGSDYVNQVFRRAPGFFDVVAYTGTGVTRTVSHNLGVVPELMIIKRRNVSSNWKVYVAALGNALRLELENTSASGTQGEWASTSPTASVFTVSDQVAVNTSSSPYIAYLFATCPGVSKVGSYTGTGTTLNVDCGFTNGSRLVLIKRTDSTGSWYIWDSARGIVSGNDPYLLLNSTAAEVTNTDYIDPLSSGFQISSTAPAEINANGGSYIFLAVA